VGFLDRLFGGTKASSAEPWAAEPPGRKAPSADEQAIERYRYLLRTAPPETIEEAHAEAFAQLTPEQRKLVLTELSAELPEHERSAGYADDPRSLARLATRTEMRRPGSLERSFGGMNARGMGFGGTMASSFLGAFAGLLIGSAIAEQFFGDEGTDQSADGGEDGDADAGDAGDAGDTGGDFGGGDFGGGDFGGGDFGGF
jgi:hypothetical protein